MPNMFLCYLFRCLRGVEARKACLTAMDQLYFPTQKDIDKLDIANGSHILIYINLVPLLADPPNARSLEWGDTWLSRDLSISHGTNHIAELYAIAVGLHNNPNKKAVTCKREVLLRVIKYNTI
jgi:hypothetical protein